MLDILKKFRHHTTHKAHRHLLSKLNWYKRWHDFKYYHHIHVGMAVIYILAVTLGTIYFLFKTSDIVLASTVQTIKTVTTEAEFNEGITSDTEVTNVSGGEVKLEGGAGNWWSANYQYRKQLTVNNNESYLLASGFAISFTFDHATLVSASKSQNDGDDIRIVYWDESANTELDRVLDYDTTWNSNSAKVWFQLQDDISPSSLDSTHYFLYYGYDSAVSPPENKIVDVAFVSTSSNYASLTSEQKNAYDWMNTSNKANKWYRFNPVIVPFSTIESCGVNSIRQYNSIWYHLNATSPGALDSASYTANVQNAIKSYMDTYKKRVIGSSSALAWAYRLGLETINVLRDGTTTGSFGYQFQGDYSSNFNTSHPLFQNIPDVRAESQNIVFTDDGGSTDYVDYHATSAYPQNATTKFELAWNSGNNGSTSSNYNTSGGAEWTYGNGRLVGIGWSADFNATHTNFHGGSPDITNFDQFWFNVFKWATTFNTPASIVAGTEQGSLAPSGTWTSSPTVDSGIIDLYWNGGWGTPNGFEADTNIANNTSISFEIRSSATGGTDVNWSTWQSLGTIDSGGGTGDRTFAVTQGNMPSEANLPTGTNRYIQIKATLASSDGVGNPTLKEFRLVYLADQSPPTNPDTINAWYNGTKTTVISDNSWYNSQTPYFEWSGATDGVGESGVEGYWVYFGTDNTADPLTAGSWQTGISYEADIQEADSGKTFYLCISTEDYAENRYTNGAPNYFRVFTYKFDKTKPNNPAYITVNPVGWSTVNNFDFSWPAASDPLSNGDASGIYGYQYKRAGGGDDWSATITDTFVNDLEAYQNGQNTFYVRSVDVAGNIASSQTQVYYYYNADAPSAPQNLGVVPPNSTTNAFTFSWTKPASYNGDIKGYYYSINSLPNQNNTTCTTQLTTGQIAAATQQGFNAFYIVAMDTSDNINWNNYASVQFECNTPAPGIPLNPEIFDTSNRDLQKYSVALNWQEPENKGVGFAGYIIERSTNGVNYSQVGTSTSTSYIDVNLQSILYYYRIKAKDNSNNVSAPSEVVSKTPTGRYTSPPNITVGPEVTAKVSTASIRWITDREASSFAEIGENVNYGLTQGQFEFVTDHKVTIERLKPDTIYHYRVKYVDDDGNIGYSADATLKTEPAPQISNTSINDIRLNSAVISWNTTAPAQSDILYGKSSGYGSSLNNVSGGYTTSHSVRLSDLDHSSIYHFQIIITDIDGNEVRGEDHIFETLKFPIISLVRLEPVKDRATATMKFTWQTNVPTASVIEYTPEGGVQQEAVKSKLETNHELVISGFLDNTFYTVKIKGRDQFGNEAVSDTQRFKTDYDTRPPKVFNVSSETSVIGAGLETRNQIVISWETDEPSTSQVEYGIGITGDTYTHKSQEDATLATTHVIVISDLKPAATYHFRVVSRDGSGNKGFSEDSYLLTEQASESIIGLIIRSLERALGWLFRI